MWSMGGMVWVYGAVALSKKEIRKKEIGGCVLEGLVGDWLARSSMILNKKILDREA